ncbi:GNAT family N-acetyltransferase [Lysobacter claricitrinus]|uniref:GNAT family N-acetyltransferase n=1 Tax=Lysobacter claricitrinus TaxID=3367728 RepID=UPI0037DB6DC3
MSEHGPRLETERLILRQWRAEDFERYAQMFAAPETHHIGGPLVLGDAWRRFLQMPGAWAIQGFAMFAIEEKSSGLWMGQAGPWQPAGWPGTEVGYALHPDAWGKGYATEACATAMDWAFDVLGWNEIIHSIDVANTASQNVAKRLGATNRGRGVFQPPHDKFAIDIWGQTREQWRARRGVAA